MRIRSIYWRDLVNEVRYWDAFDLLRNLEEEMENMRCGLTHCLLGPGMTYPEFPRTGGVTLLSPDIVKREDHVEITFPAIESIDKEKIDIEVAGRDLFVIVNPGDSGQESIGWFHLRIPPDLDIESCDARLESGRLSICIKKRPGIIRRKIVIRD